jgi:hypothetical protein
MGANPITFSDDGRLFVARDFMGTGLYELDPNGVKPPRPIDEKLVNLNAYDFGPDGRLYGPIFIRVVYLNSADKCISGKRQRLPCGILA